MIETMKKLVWICILHIALLIFSLGGICSKLASRESFLSTRFVLLYGALLLSLIVYAILWQQIIQRLPLTIAYANKAITIIWGMTFGWIFFGEMLSIRKIAAAFITAAGIILYTYSDKESGNGE